MAEKSKFGFDKFRNSDQNLIGMLYKNLRLIIRLLKDSRINVLLKLLPIGALIYLVVPFDLIPIIPIDDGLVIWLGGYLFLELCPLEIVEEHRRALSGQDIPVGEGSKSVVDGEFKDISE